MSSKYGWIFFLWILLEFENLGIHLSFKKKNALDGWFMLHMECWFQSPLIWNWQSNFLSLVFYKQNTISILSKQNKSKWRWSFLYYFKYLQEFISWNLNMHIVRKCRGKERVWESINLLFKKIYIYYMWFSM